MKETAYGLMVMLGEIQNEMNKNGTPPTLEEINALYEMAVEISDYFEDIEDSIVKQKVAL